MITDDSTLEIRISMGIIPQVKELTTLKVVFNEKDVNEFKFNGEHKLEN